MPETNFKVAKLHFVNLVTQESVAVQYNPQQFEETVEVLYARIGILGMPHQALQYLGTGNHQLRMDIFHDSTTLAVHQAGKAVRNFLLSLCYPKHLEAGDEAGILTGAPPRVLVAWPRVLSMTCRLSGLRFVNQRFNRHGDLVQFTASVSFEEVRDVRLTGVEVRRRGTLRASSQGGR